MASFVGALVGVGPIVAVLAVLSRRMRRRRTAWPLTPRLDTPADPLGPPQRANDRSPLRPRRPTLSGGMALELPRERQVDDAVA